MLCSHSGLVLWNHDSQPLNLLLAGGRVHRWPNGRFVAFLGLDDLTVQAGQLPTMTSLLIIQFRCDNQSGMPLPSSQSRRCWTGQQGNTQMHCELVQP